MTPNRSRWILHKQGWLLGLIGFMVLVFILQESLGGPRGPFPRWYGPLMAVPAEGLAAVAEIREGNFGRESVRELATWFTCALLHADISHLLYNMLALWIFAAALADLLGQRWMLALFGITAVAGSVVHALLNAGSHIPCLGASGAVMGFEGAYLGLAVRFRLPEAQVWPMTRSLPPAHLGALALVGVVFDYLGLMGTQGARIAYGAHIGGFTAGLFLTALLAPMPKAARWR
jgi:membrane associated rhomboid family serine protease